MLAALETLVDDVTTLHSKLILLCGAVESSQLGLTLALGNKKGVTPLNVGAELGFRLAGVPQRQRHLKTTTIMRELADRSAVNGLLLLTNIEILFDSTLKLDALDLLKRLATAQRVVAIWPGELREGRLVYAEIGHLEYQDYGLTGVVAIEIK